MGNLESPQFLNNNVTETNTPLDDSDVIFKEGEKENQTLNNSNESITEEVSNKKTRLRSSVLSRSRLTETQVKEAKRLAHVNPEHFFAYLDTLDVPPSTQAELASYFMKDLEDSIRRISWNKERLEYTTQILAETLKSDNKNVNSVDNLILNYLVFCDKFQKIENKLPRYGQFAYVMRSVFADVSTIEEVYSIINNRESFGFSINPSDATAFSGEVTESRSAIKRRQKENLEKKKSLDKSLSGAIEEEKEEKGRVWNGVYSEPKEYKFPHYTFQTGDKKGKDVSMGRSSWEPMFEAYADVINKNTEDRISRNNSINEKDKPKMIKEQRIELLYEKFQFPVGIRTNKNGEQKPIVYILDFIDINRWKAIEIKGPLTPKAAEKIRLFQKYYIEGDFSGLPEDEQIIMMSYVQNKLDEIRDWCKEHGFPAFDHFSSLEVLGMYKWDYDLNNFNRYEEARYMKDLSVKERQQLQKGFIKLIEDRIKSGKTPDIKPEHYVESDKLDKVVIEENKRKADKEKAPYILQENVSTKPYIPNMMAKKLVELKLNNKLMDLSVIDQMIIDTLPIHQYEKEIFVYIQSYLHDGWLISDTETKYVEEFSLLMEHIDTQKDHSKSEALNLVRRSKPEDIFTNLKSLIFGLEKLETYLEGLDRKKITVANIDANSYLQPKIGRKLISGYIKLMRSNMSTILKDINRNNLDNILNNNGNVLTELENCRVKVMDTVNFYLIFILGKYEDVFRNRKIEIHNLFSSLLQNSSDFLTKEISFIKRELDNKTYSKDKFIDKISNLSLLEESIPLGDITILENVLAFYFHSVNIRETSLIEPVRILYKDSLSAINNFHSNKLNKLSKERYLETIEKIDRINMGPSFVSPNEFDEIRDYFEDNRGVLISMANIILFDWLGEEKYFSLINRFKENLQKYQK